MKGSLERSRWWLVLPASAAVLMAVAVGSALVTLAYSRAVADKQSVAVPAVAAAVTTDQLCRGDGQVAKALRTAGLCEQARVVQQRASEVDVDPPEPAADGPSRDELLRFTRDAVAEYCSGRNDCRPDAGELVRIVAEYLEANPPEPGEDATPEQIAEAARTVLTEDPDLFRGPGGERGADGERGPGPTPEQIATAVAEHCANGQCRGPQGVGVVDIRPERNGEGVCQWVIVFENPATSERREVRHPAGDAACPAVAPPAGPPPEDPPGGLLPGG